MDEPILRKLAKNVAKDVFESFAMNGDRCQRLAIKGGTYPDAETNLGGVCETALAERLEQSLKRCLGA